MTTSFAELGLNEQILAGVNSLGFSEPTPVQAEAIPLVLAGRDVVASAQTGTGKTAAFALPVLQLIAGRATGLADSAAGVQAGTVAADSAAGVQAGTVAADSAASATSDGVNAAKAPAAAAPAEDGANAAVATAVETPSPENGTASATDKDGEAPRPRRRRRRRRKKGQAAQENAAQGEGGAALSGTQGDGARASAQGYGPYALVVTPTRELAQQIERVASAVCANTGQHAVVVLGGARFDRQIKALRQGCDLLVATPGRLLDLMERKVVDLGKVEVLVLDEADRMLDMGFWPSVRRIMQALPRRRQTLLFSATIPPSIKSTIDAMLHDPATVEIARVGQTADTVEEHLCPVTQGQKTQLLQALLSSGGAMDVGNAEKTDSTEDMGVAVAMDCAESEGGAKEGAGPERVLVFCRTKHRVDDVCKTLRGAGVKVEEMHADRRQRDREKALAKFRDGKVQVLVATDVMSRGIDVSGIDAVVNYDVPMDPEDYVHRIGRTGRAGATGHAYTFVAPDEISPLREIEYFTGKLVPVWDLPGFSYDEGRIVPNAGRSAVKPKRTMFSGSKGRRGFGGPSTGRFGRHF